MRNYLRLNNVLESLIEYYIIQHLRSENGHLDDELTCDHRIIIHSVEVLDNDLLLANVEHSLYDAELGKYCAPAFAQIELTSRWPAEVIFNSEAVVYDEADSYI